MSTNTKRHCTNITKHCNADKCKKRFRNHQLRPNKSKVRKDIKNNNDESNKREQCRWACDTAGEYKNIDDVMPRLRREVLPLIFISCVQKFCNYVSHSNALDKYEVNGM